MTRLIAALIATALFTSAMATDGEARIRCNGAYQVVPGHGELATPYCEDNYLAEVARGYGIRISARAIRSNPSRKEEVCRAVGHDGRVYATCLKYRNDSCRGYDC